MAIIKNHQAFVRAVRGFAKDNESLLTAIEQDMRDKMMESEFYGLSALNAAEKWFDALPVEYLKFAPDAQLPVGTKIVLRQQISASAPKLCAMWWDEGGNPFNVLYGGATSPFVAEEFDVIAIQS